MPGLWRRVQRLTTRDLGFSVDAEGLYESAFADRDQPEIQLLRLAESLRGRRVANHGNVLALQRVLAGGLVGVGLEVAGFATAIAVHGDHGRDAGKLTEARNGRDTAAYP